MLVEQAAECGVVSTNILNNSAKDNIVVMKVMLVYESQPSQFSKSLRHLLFIQLKQGFGVPFVAHLCYSQVVAKQAATYST